MSEVLDLLQWPAMLATVAGSWMVGSANARRRCAGFWVFLASNVLWIAWAWHADVTSMVAMQVALAAINIRGMSKADRTGDRR